MRKTLALCLVALSCAMNVSAQVEKFGICDHLGAGLSVGTDGIGIEVATTLTDYVAVRAGMSIVPRFKYGFDVSTYGSSVVTKDEVRAEGKLRVLAASLAAASSGLTYMLSPSSSFINNL